MDAINMKKMDKSLLNSSYDNISTKETDPKKLREEKYRNININDMLNPTVGSQMHKEYTPDAIEEFVKAKKQEKSSHKGYLEASWRSVAFVDHLSYTALHGAYLMTI